MIEIPRIAPGYHAEVVGDATVVLVSETDHVLLKGELLAAVIARIDGRRSSDEIAAALDDQALPTDVYYVMTGLAQKGYVSSALDPVSGTAALWADQGIHPAQAERRLARTPVAIVGVGDVSTVPLQAALEACGVRIAEPAALTVVLADDYLHPRLEAFNREALSTRQPWMLARPAGAPVWVGPVFLPGRTGCWACLARRLQTTRPLHALTQSKMRGTAPLAVAQPEASDGEGMAYRLQALQVAQWIGGRRKTQLEGRILTFDALAWRSESHDFVRFPDCTACGRAAGGGSSIPPVRFESRKKAYRSGGSHRSVPPEETLESFAHHISRVTGAVRYLRRCSVMAGSGVSVYMAGYHPARPLHRDDLLAASFHRGCAGKGTTDAEARASGLGEALERYSAQFQGNEPRLTGRLADLGEQAIHPNRCMGFSARQYGHREALNARGSRFQAVPAPFDEAAEIEWSPVWSLTRNAVAYLPTAYCYLSYAERAEARYCVGDTNGNAAGVTLEEAVLQGFFELVERDAVALWWYNRVRRPQVDLGSFHHPSLRRSCAFLRHRGRAGWALDLTTDLGIPVFVFLSRSLEGAEAINMGFGAHFDPEIALQRAVTEHMQTLAPLLPPDGERGVRPDARRDPDVLRWLSEATLAGHPYLAPDGGAQPRSADDFARATSDDLREDLLRCQSIVERHGMEMLIHDLTRPEIGLPVVKVIVPGLRHFWARFAPGRLFDVPVKLAWRERPLSEEELNPLALFL